MAALMALAPSIVCGAQVIAPIGTYPPAIQKQQQATPPPPKTSAATTANPANSYGSGLQRTPPSLLDQASSPAKISFSEGRLAVDANNSSLLSILQQIATQSGMKIEGSSKDQRIFGTYGPGAPREVILSLLEGSGYNVVMVGATAHGVPRRLELSTRGQESVPPPQASVQESSADDNDSGADDGQIPPAEPMPPQVITPASQAPPPQAPAQDGVKTPQQLLQELQRMHDQQQQQQNPQ
ncbi:hypothetical protein [Acidipila rosea]|nr:hypothetical protein [Acidipila rosea]